jgi:hypothetical protein
MKQYQVIALSVGSDKTGKIYNAGDILPQDAFHDGHAEKLVDEGFLKVYTGKKTEHIDTISTDVIVDEVPETSVLDKGDTFSTDVVVATGPAVLPDAVETDRKSKNKK